MARVLGENFEQYVTDQINVRQSALGTVEKTPQNVLVFNSNKPWLRVASSVDISQEKANELGVPNLAESNLARDYILAGGILNDFGQQTSGVISDFSTDREASFRVAYGHTYAEEFGLTPPPGIKSVTINSLNDGALRKATIQLVCFSPAQFSVVDALYLRIGMTLLVEWGHSTYYDNTGGYQTKKEFSSAALDGFLAGTVDQFSVLRLIEKEREKEAGNYDALFGKVTNYNYTYNQGTYEINIEIYSMGDVIESLKVNGTIDVDFNTNTNTSGSSETQPLLISNRKASLLNAHLYYWMDQLDAVPLQQKETYEGGYCFIDQTQVSKDKNLTVNKELVKIQFRVKTSQEKATSAEYYIKLGTLLRYIDRKILVYNKTLDKPLIRLFQDEDYDDTLMFTLKEQYSSDPKVCLVPFYDRPNNYSRLGEVLGTQFRATDTAGIYAARLMHVHVNMNHVAKIIKDSADKNNKVSLYTLLTKLVADISKSLGSINNLQISYDHDSNVVLIVDKTRIPGYTSDKKPNTAIFTLVGANPTRGYGTFIKNLTFQSQLTRDLSTMMAISAQAGGNVVGEDGTFFSKINKGLTDRVIPERVDASTVERDKTSNDSETVEEKFASYQSALKEVLTAVYKRFKINNGTLEVLKGIQADYLRYIRGELSKKNEAEAQGFIPLNLGLEMQGLGGIKIFQQFSVTQEILPSYYTGNLSFIIKGVNHTIDPGGWTTTVESLSIASVSSNKSTAEQLEQQIKKTPVTTVPKGEGNTAAVRGNPQLRQVLINAGYQPNTAIFELALSIGTKEGWSSTANGGVGSRSYRNNNPGNLDFSPSLRSIDPNVKLENNPFGKDRFAHFSTAELGAQALVEAKIKMWARGRMPVTAGNQGLITARKGGAKYNVGTKPTIAQFVYTYAPPNENNTENYINSIVSTLKSKFPAQNINRNTVVNDLIA
jgi:hypothetical protein